MITRLGEHVLESQLPLVQPRALKVNSLVLDSFQLNTLSRLMSTLPFAYKMLFLKIVNKIRDGLGSLKLFLTMTAFCSLNKIWLFAFREIV